MENETEKTSYVLWLVSFLIVCVFYAAIGLGFVVFYTPDSRAIGGVEAIMLEFAPEAQTADVEEISQKLQEEAFAEAEEMIEPEAEPAAVPKPKSLPEQLSEPEPEIESTPELVEPSLSSDRAEEPISVKEIKQQEIPKQPAIPARKPQKKSKFKPQVKSQAKISPKQNSPKPAVKKAEKTQKAKGPQLTAPKGQKFAAPKTSLDFGNQGKVIAGWQTRVQRKIAISAQRLKKIGNRKTFTAVVSFRYDAHGTLTAASIARSSGDGAADSFALKAVKNASPIPAPPTGQAGALRVPVRIER